VQPSECQTGCAGDRPSRGGGQEPLAEILALADGRCQDHFGILNGGANLVVAISSCGKLLLTQEISTTY
ncbi:hypothetical protein, partial [Burkholderia cenocepacia]|uniref:hypothetical protein n=1 Tax=Burkholderia cenocepacia TaxID=95486 RepID=UPI00197F67D5